MNDEQKTDFRRQTAYKCSVETLINGVFVRTPGWESSYLMTEYGDFSRVNVVAVIVEKDESSITVDDGTGKITARVFDNKELIRDINIGDVVILIGRPREYNSKTYLTIDIIKKIKNKGWINYRRKELSLIKKIRDKIVPEVDATLIESQNTITSKDRIIKIIKDLDSGQGADIDEVIRFSKIKNAEEIIKDFILKGVVFEIKPGRIKIL
ncbi:MAG: hypothetical protein KatS3mg002_0598 [Candidatus Woesearchaeota archaeon]|nr:MAG: hypothetical protein KatS3mg002_0598 [Candidatus Woesearchaeota archaeon]